MYKKIPVPVDGSPSSMCGLHQAIELAKDQMASLRLFHVVDELSIDARPLEGSPGSGSSDETAARGT